MKNLILIVFLLISTLSFANNDKKVEKPEVKKEIKISKTKNFRFIKSNDGYRIIRKDLLFKSNKSVLA